jgi:hypothetical protein
MKKLICVLLVMAILLAPSAQATAVQTNEQLVLSELSDEELIEFLIENGVEIPTRFESNEECIAFARRTIEAVEQDSNARFHYGFKYLQDFSDDIIAVVRKHYGNYGISTRAYGSPNIVQDNVVLGAWKEEYEQYNCYAYAISYWG